MRRIKKAMLASLGCAVLAAPLQAAVVPTGALTRDKEYRNPALYVPNMHTPLSALKGQAFAAQLQQDLLSLGVPESGAYYDVAAERWGSLLPSEPLIPGTGVGNRLEDISTVIGDEPAFRQRVWSALMGWLQRHESVLRVDTDELARPNMTISENGTLVQIWAPRRVGGVIVRDSQMVAVVNHGNLVLIGFQNWAPANVVPLDPALSAEQAKGVAAAHVSPAAFVTAGKKAHLELVPMAREKGGYEFRLAWVVGGKVEGDLGTWEALVDATTGDLIAFADQNQYALKKVVGGVFPVSSDGIPPDGVEVRGMSMPYIDVTFPNGTTEFANSSGVIGCGANPGPGGPGPRGQFLRSHLSGKYVRIDDNCALPSHIPNEKSLFDSELNFDLGGSGGTDCVVPAGHNPGDTHSARSGFYELNRLIEQARGYLPANTWLQSQLTSNMNLDQTCNAFWNGSTVNFFKSGGGCNNSGEIAAIFDHEWGHGIDNNGANPSGSVPGESIADIHSILRLQESCMARGFTAQNCGGYGDPCTACTGIRELDFAKHTSGNPHGITNFIATLCPAQGTRGPCNRETHCEGMIVAEAAWDVSARDLRAAPFNFDANTALEATTRLFYLAAEPVTNWYQCSGTPPTGDGCNALGGYLNAIAVDDDNGNLTDGTPHMTAIFAAFNRHQIACATPAVVNSGCVGGPSTAPTLTTTPADQGGTITWTPVAGATRYAVYRTEGVRGCNFGKVKVGETTGLSFADTDLANGNTYFYSVLPIGAAGSCLGRMSACSTLVPVAGSNMKTLAPPAIQVIGGDNDGVLDNCETARLTVKAENTGITTLTNVRVVAVASSSHPLSTPTTPLPATLATSLAACGQASGTIDVTPHGMNFNDTFTVTVTITADQIFPATRQVTYTAGNVESDFANVATRTYDFNAGFQGWITSGTFTRVDAGGGNFYLASSSCLDDQCDIAQSPVVKLTNTSTLSLVQRYDTEIPTPIPYDRANVGVRTLDNAVRTAVLPSGGKLYDLNPGAPNGVCETTGQAGWSADTDADCTPNAAFLSSTWTAAALNPGNAFTGRQGRISVNFGSDPGGNGWGFHFDDVVLTNFQEQVPDAQACTFAPDATSAKPSPLAPGRTVRRAKR